MDIIDTSAPSTDKDAGVPAVQPTQSIRFPQVSWKTQEEGWGIYQNLI